MSMLKQTPPHLAAPFTKLPFTLDVAQLQREASDLMAESWLAHPQQFAGNLTLPLVSVNGQYNHDFAIAGQMLPTPALQRCPYIRQIMAHLRVPISRTRLMLLTPGAEVARHYDAGYHWHRRIRIHIPIFTHPNVLFGCGDQTVHMQAGEAWCFDHRQWHWVKNNSPFSRVHLVIDTKGTPDFFASLSADESQNNALCFETEKSASFKLEPYRFEVLAPDELAALLFDIKESLTALNETQTVARLERLNKQWQAAFDQYGHSVEGESTYAELIKKLTTCINEATLTQEALRAYITITTLLDKRNGIPIKKAACFIT